MWPFRRKHKDRKSKIIQRVVVGVIIGGAIGSIVGKKVLEKHAAQKDEKSNQ